MPLLKDYARTSDVNTGLNYWTRHTMATECWPWERSWHLAASATEHLRLPNDSETPRKGTPIINIFNGFTFTKFCDIYIYLLSNKVHLIYGTCAMAKYLISNVTKDTYCSHCHLLFSCFTNCTASFWTKAFPYKRSTTYLFFWILAGNLVDLFYFSWLMNNAG